MINHFVENRLQILKLISQRASENRRHPVNSSQTSHDCLDYNAGMHEMCLTTLTNQV